MTTLACHGGPHSSRKDGKNTPFLILLAVFPHFQKIVWSPETIFQLTPWVTPKYVFRCIFSTRDAIISPPGAPQAPPRPRTVPPCGQKRPKNGQKMEIFFPAQKPSETISKPFWTTFRWFFDDFWNFCHFWSTTLRAFRGSKWSKNGCEWCARWVPGSTLI